MAKYKTMYRRKTFYRRRRKYAKAVNMSRNYFSEKLKKRFTLAVPVLAAAGQVAFYGTSLNLNLADALKASDSYSLIYENTPLFQRLRISGVSLEWLPSVTDQAPPPFVLSLFPDYGNETIVPQTVIDQRDRMLLLPALTSRPQRKYWAFPSKTNIVGLDNLPVLGGWIDVKTFNKAAVNQVPGQMTVVALANTVGTYTMGTFMLNIYTELDKPLR